MNKRILSIAIIIMTVCISACSNYNPGSENYYEVPVSIAPTVTETPVATNVLAVTENTKATNIPTTLVASNADNIPTATNVAIVTATPTVIVDTRKEQINRIEEIMNITDVRATPEYDMFSCYIDVNDKTNPYDVNWDYGKDYDKLVNSCDFDKIFDADFYSETYPYLALMYHGNTELLKKHFMTVGIHEGRTGKKGFCYAEIISILKKYFTSKSDAKLIKRLPAENATDGNFAAAYVIYLDHITKITKKNIKADTKYADMDFHKNILTKVQKTELDEINAYRKEVGAVELNWNHTMAESANYRAYESVVNNLKAHTWIKTHQTESIDFMHYINGSYYDENTLTITHRYTKDVTTRDLTGWAKSYYNSPSHKEAMLEKDSIKYGGSNLYGDGDTLRQFDLFANTKR